MKKLLSLLLMVVCTLTLSAQDFKVGMNFGADANVGDEIELKFEIFPAEGQSITATFLQFDVNWNNKLIQYVSHTIDPYSKLTNPQLNRDHWDGYKFNPDAVAQINNLTDQYNHWRFNGAYTANQDFSVDRYTIQSTGDINLYDAVLIMKFKVLDRAATNYTDYSDIFSLSWARLEDNRTDPKTEYTVVSSNQTISLNPGGIGAGDVTLTLDVPHANKGDYGYSVYNFSQLEGMDWDSDGTIDSYTPKVDEVPVESGNFDSNGVATLSTLSLDELHWVHTHTTYDGTSHPAWLDDVVTVTDVFKIFQFSLDSDINGGGGSWQYKIQDILGEVTNDGKVDFDDSYELLAHINGVEVSSNVTSKDNGPFSLSALKDVYGTFGSDDWHTFTPTESNKTFVVAHGLRGDVDFSHSTVPTAAGSEWTSQNTVSKSPSRALSIINNNKVESSNLDISSRLEDGKVIVDVNVGTSGLAGTQFKINFDVNMLELEDVIYDTGNEMTNFGSIKDGVASFGSLDYNGEKTVKVGTPYKLVFRPKQQITNTIGLVSFKISEGVKTDGTKVKFE